MKAVVGFIAFLFFLHFANPTFATAPNITAYPNTAISLDTSFTVTATMSGLTNNAIYRLRVAIPQSTTSTTYFGSTYDGATWHMGSIADGNFISITTDGNGAWGGDIQGKIDSDDPNFTTGSGTYDLKIGRYTQTGNTSATWSNSVTITITVPPTPIPTLTPMPTPTNTPTPTTASSPTSAPTPTPTRTPTPTPSPAKTLTPTPILNPPISSAQENVMPASVLGENTQPGGFSLPTDTGSSNENALTPNKPESTNNNWFQKISIFVGIVFILACAILMFWRMKKGELTQNEEE